MPVRTVVGFVAAAAYDTLAPRSDGCLSPAERNRYRALTFRRRQESYLLGRYSAKLALGEALGEPDPRAIEITPGVFDQPLVIYPTRERYEISITHNEWGALAVAFPEGHPMGIDLETPTPARLDTILTQLTPEERKWTQPDPLPLATLAWTAREALSKVLRCGLMVSMEILETGPPLPLEPGVWQGCFRHFPQYQFMALRAASGILSLVHPRHSTPVEAPKALAAMLGPVPSA